MGDETVEPSRGKRAGSIGSYNIFIILIIIVKIDEADWQFDRLNIVYYIYI